MDSHFFILKAYKSKICQKIAGAREETDYQFEIILYMHRIFQMFEFAASGGAVSQKRLHQKRSIFSNCLVDVGEKFKHHKFLENVKIEETNNIDSILGNLCTKLRMF